MALDNAQFISELSITDPPGTDPLSEGDDQIRTTKRATFQSFPFIDKEVTTTADELNDVAIKSANNQFTANGLSTTTGGLVLVSPNVALITKNTSAPVGDQIWLADVNNVGAYRIRTRNDTETSGNVAISIDRTSTNVDAVSLHQGAGLKRLSTAAGGVAVLSGNGTFDNDIRQLHFSYQDGTLRGFIGHGGTNAFTMGNEINSGLIELKARDSAAVVRTILSGDPDSTGFTILTGRGGLQIGVGTANALGIQVTSGGEAQLHNNSVKRFVAAPSGGADLFSDGDTDTENRKINFRNADETLRGVVGHEGSPTLELANRILGGDVLIKARNTGAADRDILRGDPDALTTLGATTNLRLNVGVGVRAINCVAGAGVDIFHDGTVTCGTTALAAGGFTVGDAGGVQRKAGFRNPATTAAGSGRTLTQADEGTVISVDGVISLTVDALEAGTQIDLIGNSGNFELIQGTVTLRHLNGGGAAGPTGTRQVARGSIVHLHWEQTNFVDVWGNGIT